MANNETNLAFERLIERIDAIYKRLDKPIKDTLVRKRLYEIGNMVQNEAKKNVTKNKMIDQGHLRASISFRTRQERNKAVLEIGSYGIPYARIQELGGTFPPAKAMQMRRAMFATLSRAGRLKANYQSKVIFVGNKWVARPYLRIALIDNREKILKILGDGLTSK